MHPVNSPPKIHVNEMRLLAATNGGIVKPHKNVHLHGVLRLGTLLSHVLLVGYRFWWLLYHVFWHKMVTFPRFVCTPGIGNSLAVVWQMHGNGVWQADRVFGDIYLVKWPKGSTT